MKSKIVETSPNKYGILSEFEVGKSGTFAQRMLITGISRKKATALLSKLESGEI